MKILKTDRRSQLNKKNMEALLQIKVEGGTLQDFINTLSKKAVNLWWEAKQRRVQQGRRKAFAKKEQNRENKQSKFFNEFIDNFFETNDSEDEDICFQS